MPKQYFSAFHKAIELQYNTDCECDYCKSVGANPRVRPDIELSLKDGIQSILSKAMRAFARLHKNKGYKPEDLFNTKEYTDLIDETSKLFNSTITHETSDTLRSYLQQDSFIFSGLRTHAQLTEASSWLLDDKGNIMPYHRFEQKVLELNDKYNKNYLQAEYQFAIHSAQSAHKWETAYDDDDDFYLQYRTAGDKRVREAHKDLNGITLPKNDAFWNEYYPPNGWRCRCTVVQVLADRHKKSDSKEAIEKGIAATTQIGKNGKNRLEMFRFNPGAQKKMFPPKNSYTKIAGAGKVKKEAEKRKVVYEKISNEQLKQLYSKQNINTKNERIVNNQDTGYVQTINSFEINSKLRNNQKLSEKEKETVKALDNLIKNNKLPNNIMLYRNVSNNFLESHFGQLPQKASIKDTVKYLKNKKVKSIKDKGYCSTSAIEEKNVFKSRLCHLEIKANTGTHAFVTNNFLESEIILGRNQKLKIIDIKVANNEQITIYLETF